MAAALAVVTMTGLVVLGGGLRRTGPSPAPSGLPATIASIAPPSAGPSPSVDALAEASPSAVASTSPCRTWWAQTATTANTWPGHRMELDSFRTGTQEIYGSGLTITLRQPVSALPRISIQPINPPFKSQGGRPLTIAGSTFLAVRLEGLTRHYIQAENFDMAAHDVAPGQLLGPGIFGVVPPVREIRLIRDTVGTTGKQLWIVGLEHPVCLRPVTEYELITDGEPPGDNVIFIGLDPESP
jgi:hypothetical protein